MQCPKCKYHTEPIFTIEISPKTNQRWRIERCPHCNYGYNLELEREYQDRVRKMDKSNDGWPIRSDDVDKRGWL